MAGTIGLGTTFTWNVTPITELTRIGAMGMTLNMVDTTVINPTDEIRTFVAGLISLGEIVIEGLFDPQAAAQLALFDDFLARTERDWTMTFPVALGSKTFKAKGHIVSYSAGDATNEGLIPFTITIKLSTKPALGA